MASDKPTYVDVPQPPLKPIIGNLGEIDGNMPIQSFMKLARIYGPFFRMRLLDRNIYIASSQEIVDELCDEKRFTKRVSAPLQQIRAVTGDGLFTADGDNPNWGKAHRILVPAFGPIAIRGMFDRMIDVADQMFTRWERFGPDAVIDVADNMTRLTLDTIALCAFDYRFNSFYQDQMHPFVAAMVATLKEAGDRNRRPKVMNALMLAKARDFEANCQLMHKVARDLIAERRRDPKGSEKNDLLNLMLNGVDPVTGTKLDDENIIYQMITFLIAGHETTSGMLTFTTYLLIKNPEILQKARALVDQVLGEQMPRVEHLAQLHYLEQVLMESLRLWPTAAAFTVRPLEDTLLAGKYALGKQDTVMILSPILHRDPEVWEEPEAFWPERFAPEVAKDLPANAWKAFGNGARACIGRPFAMQEATLVLTMMLQRFDFVLDDPSYTLRVHETLTIKPENLKIRAKARRSSRSLVRSPVLAAPARSLSQRPTFEVAGQVKTQLLVLFGSNSGSAEAFANRIAGDAPAQGFTPTLAPMDHYAGSLPSTGPVIVVTASYEGQPPDNARQFIAAIEAVPAGTMKNVFFSVFGCGNRQWARTYQAVPKRVDAALAKAGARRIAERGETDSGGDFFGAFDEWYAKLWLSLATALGREATVQAPTSTLHIEFVRTGRESMLRLSELQQGTVVENRELVDMTAPGARSKRHIEFLLPEGTTYRAGDYLVVLPRNPASAIFRVLRRFGLTADTMMILSREGGASGSLPTGHPTVCGELLAHYVELSQPATRAQVAALAAATRCPSDKIALEALAGADYEADVLSKRCSVIDLLDRFHACELPFAAFLDMLPPMRARQYSISSSPLWKANHVSLTVAVINAPAFSGKGRFEGVASSYLARLEPGDRVSIAVRPSNARFHPPEDPRTPVVMICAGSGVAPFRGFLQDRAAQKAGGREVGPALLFFGTDHPDVDYLYQDDFAAWEKDGVATIFPAFSSKPERDIRFVQHRLWSERKRIAEAFRNGGIIYVCGDGQRMAPAVRETLIRIYREDTGSSDSDAQQWADVIEHERGRYVSDVFA